MHAARNFKMHSDKPSLWRQIFNHAWQLLVAGRNAIVIFVTMTISMALEQPDGSNVFTLTSDIPLGLPKPVVPAFVLLENSTITRDFKGVMSDLGVAPLILGK